MATSPIELSLVKDDASVTRRMVAFARLLRDNGFALGFPEIRDALAIARDGALLEPRTIRQGWRAIFCANRADWGRFDELFNLFWLRRGMRRSARVRGATRRPTKRKTIADLAAAGRALQPDDVAGDDAGETAPHSPAARHQGASGSETLAEKDLRHVRDEDELKRAHELAEELARAMRHRLSRRERSGLRGRRLDLRKVIHRSIPYGGTPMRLAFRRRPSKPLRLVLILDASGSMSQYASFFLRFMRGVLGTFREADAYALHTRLVHIARALEDRDPERAFERLSLMTAGWSGGTRIGDCLALFNRYHARHAVNGRTAVMILSDGYDTSPPEVLARELARLRRRARHVIWLNPLLGWEGYQPVAKGMAAALPHLDLFLPAHSLESLAALEPHLARL